MYAVTISLRAIDKDSVPVLRQASLDVVGPSRAESACLFFDVLFDDADPLLIRFYEAYVDEAGYNAHFETAHLKAWQARCIPLIDRASIRMPESISNHGAQTDGV